MKNEWISSEKKVKNLTFMVRPLFLYPLLWLWLLLLVMVCNYTRTAAAAANRQRTTETIINVATQ